MLIDLERRLSQITPDGSGRKRHSIFARNHDDHTEHRAWPRLFTEPTSVTEMLPPAPASDTTKRLSRSVSMRHSRQDPILRWMKRVEPIAEAEVARELLKATISEPFGFQHVSHTDVHSLPEFDFASDRGLTRSFWAACAGQTPRGDLQGIKAEDLDKLSVASRSASRISLHTALVEPADITRRSSVSRSASLASLIAEQREPPSALHPAFRNAADASTSSQNSALQTPSSESTRNLDVVFEEVETPSPKRPSMLQRQSAVSNIESSFDEVKDSGSSRQYTPSSRSDCQDTSETSATSLSSGETWEVDVDFCYNMEAESTCDFRWPGNMPLLGSPHDSFATTPKSLFANVNNIWNVSPRTSMANHQRNKSSMAMTPTMTSPLTLTADFRDSRVFEDPRPAPATPVRESDDLNSLLDMASHFGLDWQDKRRSASIRSFQINEDMDRTPRSNNSNNKAREDVCPPSPRSPSSIRLSLSPVTANSALCSPLLTQGRFGLTCQMAPSPPPTYPLPPLPTGIKPLTVVKTAPARPSPPPLRHAHSFSPRSDTPQLTLRKRSVSMREAVLRTMYRQEMDERPTTSPAAIGLGLEF